MSLLIYGTGGFTGSSILERARHFFDAVPAARRPSAAELEAGALALDLGDASALRRALEPHEAVLNCAGPFARTWRPLVEACLDTGTHYLDIGAEWAVFEALHGLDAKARARGVALLPGVGFDVVASDCLAAHVAGRLPGARRLLIGISGLELVSRGSARTMLGEAGQPVRRRRGGVLVAEPRLREERFDFGRGPRLALGVSWADIVTAFHTTGIPDIEVYFEATPLVTSAFFANRTFGWILRHPLLQSLADAQLDLWPEGPRPHERAARRCTLVARVEDATGAKAESRLVTPEAYTFSVLAAVEAARRSLSGGLPAGFQTPARVFGADFAVELEGIERSDLD